MEVNKVRERADGVKQVTIPADSKIEEGDYVTIQKIEEQTGELEAIDEDILQRLREIKQGDVETLSLDEVREQLGLDPKGKEGDRK
jgi:hypothetical protein